MLFFLAATKAALVSLFFMHLAVEKRTLAYIALTPAVLCVLLVFALLPDLGAFTRALTHATSVTAEAHEGRAPRAAPGADCGRRAGGGRPRRLARPPGPFPPRPGRGPALPPAPP